MFSSNTKKSNYDIRQKQKTLLEKNDTNIVSAEQSSKLYKWNYITKQSTHFMALFRI